MALVAAEEDNSASVDQPKILCIIRDMTDPSSNAKVVLNLQQSYTINDLMKHVGKEYRYDPETFKLTYDTDEDSFQLTMNGGYADVGLGHLCPFDGKRRRHNFFIMELDGPPEKLAASAQSPEDGATVSLKSMHPLLGGETLTTRSEDEMSYAMAAAQPSVECADGDDHGFRGLVNQAMTCYLNSLLQTLFMTPEFRNALYRWQFEGTASDGEQNIPYQLQKLFLNLQTSEKASVETTCLTRSFGWDSSEAWQQHDVQELCRVMFDSLETSLRDTEQAQLINRLYQGKVKDYVKCLECGYENSKVDVYLDLALPIRPFGSTQSFGTITEAMKAYIQPELLEGSNQYSCERCNKKCDAHKGLQYVEFPYLLTLQLLRFEFDYSTLQRIKLNDKMTFPDTLKLGDLLLSEKEGGSADDVQQDGDVTTAASGDSSHGQQYIYELFSILIHSGSAVGGHYYAYIKSLEDRRWYCFNDQRVTTITYDDIRRTYGGGYNYSSMYNSSTNAYMLMYRRVDHESNKDFTAVDALPEHIQTMLQTLKDDAVTEQERREREKSMCKINLVYDDPMEGRKRDQSFEISEKETLKEATRKAMEQMEVSLPVDRCRLVKYDESQDTVSQSYDVDDDDTTSMGELLGGTRRSYAFELLLQTRGEEEESFPEYTSRADKKTTITDVQSTPSSSRTFQQPTYSNLTIR